MEEANEQSEIEKEDTARHLKPPYRKALEIIGYSLVVAVIAFVIIVSALGIYAVHHINFAPPNFGEQQGYIDLYVPLSGNYSDFNVSMAVGNLTADGYSPYSSCIDELNSFYFWLDNLSYRSNWSIFVTWEITNETYVNTYKVHNLTVFIAGHSENNTTNLLFLGVSTPYGSVEEPRREATKNIAKEAAFDIARTIGVNLDWDNHYYDIAWTTMTSEGEEWEK